MTGTLPHPQLVPPEEAALIERARDGDQTAWTRLYDRCYPAVYRYVRARVFDPDAAEDVAAEVFVGAVRGVGRYRQQGRPFLAWLFGIAAHAIADHQRSVGRQRKLGERLLPSRFRAANPPEASPPAELFATTGDHDALVARLDLAQALDGLTAAQREVVILRYFVGLETGEIAAVMGKDASAVYSLHARALLALRGLLSEKDLPAADESRPSRAISTVEA